MIGLSKKKIKGKHVLQYVLTQTACEILEIPYEPERPPLLLTETVLQDLQDKLQTTGELCPKNIPESVPVASTDKQSDQRDRGESGDND
jgi:hypothetical protein